MLKTEPSNKFPAIFSNIILIAVNALIFAYSFQLKHCDCLKNPDNIDVSKDWKYHYIVYYSLVTTILFSIVLLLRVFNVSLVPTNKALIIFVGLVSLIFLIASIIQGYTLFFFMKKIHLQHEVDKVIKNRDPPIEPAACENNCRDRPEMFIIYYYSIILFVLYTLSLLGLVLMLLSPSFRTTMK